MADALHEVLILRLRDGHLEEAVDVVAMESRLELRLNGQRVVSLLCTPRDLEAMAAGFLHTEGLVAQRSALASITVAADAIDVRARDLPGDWRERIGRATLASGCGRGMTLTDPGRSGELRPLRAGLVVSGDRIGEMLRDFVRRSELFRRTGGVHSAALVEPGGRVLCFAEDIGRHNAVDKVIGMAFLKGMALGRTILLSSGRVSTEIMTKTIRAGVPVLISRAAPTCLSVSLAEDYGVTLVGFARGRRFNIYGHPGRIALEEDPAVETGPEALP